MYRIMGMTRSMSYPAPPNDTGIRRRAREGTKRGRKRPTPPSTAMPSGQHHWRLPLRHLEVPFSREISVADSADVPLVLNQVSFPTSCTATKPRDDGESIRPRKPRVVECRAN